MQEDRTFMKLALSLAKKGKGLTNPNPMVGAVVVKDRRIVGRGYHKGAGLEHAEVSALREAAKDASGAALYVNLEPCGHFGRTPPCTQVIIRSGVKRVVAAMKDPNPMNNGRGFERLRAAGLSVTTGVLEEEAKQLNEIFVKYVTTKRPFVIAKAAQSIDGKIATTTGDSKWISCEEARRFVHKLRTQVDAVMVGAGTVVKDDPLLTNRQNKTKQPVKIVVASTLRIPLNARIFGKDLPARVIIATTRKASKSRIEKFKKITSEVLILGEKNDRVDLRQLVKELGKRDITSILVEGGGELMGSLVDEKLIDKFLFFIAPKIIGGRTAITSVEGEGIKRISHALVLKNLKYKKFGSDLLIEAYSNVHRHN